MKEKTLSIEILKKTTNKPETSPTRTDCIKILLLKSCLNILLCIMKYYKLNKMNLEVEIH